MNEDVHVELIVSLRELQWPTMRRIMWDSCLMFTVMSRFVTASSNVSIRSLPVVISAILQGRDEIDRKQFVCRGPDGTAR